MGLPGSWRTRGQGWFAAAAVLTATTAHAQVVINEVDYDQPSTDTAEFLELMNTGATAVDLSGYTLVFINGNGNSEYQEFALPAIELAAQDYFVVCANAATVANCDMDVSPDTNLIQNGAPDALALLLDGTIVDALSYEGDVPGYVETSGAGAESGSAADEGLSRCPVGSDTDDNSADFVLTSITPGEQNNCGGEPEPEPSIGACGDGATAISAIQGNGASTPLGGQDVVIEGVVVGDFQDDGINGFFVQEEDADVDGDPTTSEGIFVYESSLDVAVNVGDLVRVAGQATEYSSLTELTNVSDVVVCGTGVASPSLVSFPVDSVDGLEAYEGMAVTIAETMTVTEVYELGRYGSVLLSSGGRLRIPTHEALPGSAATAVDEANAKRVIFLDDATTSQNPNPIPYLNAANTRRIGDTVTGLQGVLSGRFGEYRIQPTGAVSFDDDNARPEYPEDVGGNLKVASFNVLNFFTTIDEGGAVCGPAALGCRGADSAEEFERQRVKLLNALERLNADVVGLMEIENDQGAAAQNLVDGLNERLGAGTYAAVETGYVGTDAIKLAFIYKPAVVSLAGAFAVLDSSVDARFIDDKNRPALAQSFELVSNGALVTVVNNHLKSKGSACDDVGDPNTGDLQGNCNGTRTAAAEALADWLATAPTGVETDNVLIIGDLNAYRREDPILALTGAGYTDLLEAFVGDEAYSYVYDGEAGYLDHALASSALLSQVTGVTEWHINTDEPLVMDYNLEYKTDDPFDGSHPFRASDHDPLLVGLSLQGAVPYCHGQPASIYVKDNRVVGGPLDGQRYRGKLVGTRFDDVIVGTPRSEIILPLFGDDLVCGGGGRDRILGDFGHDRYFDGQGEEVCTGRRPFRNNFNCSFPRR